MVEQARILVVDDEPAVVQLCTRLLTGEGYTVHGVDGGQQALDLLETKRFDLLLVDLVMADVDGLAVLWHARKLDPDVTAIVITGYGTIENAIEALEAGARGFVLKPFEPDDLLQAVHKALVKRRQEQEDLRLRIELPILEISQTLMIGDDVKSLAGRLLEVVMEQIEVDRASLMLLDEQTNELYIAGALGLPAEVVQKTRIPVGQGISGQVILREDPLVLNETDNLAPAWRSVMARSEIASAVSLPLRVGESNSMAGSGDTLQLPLRTGQRTTGVLNLSRLVGRAPFTPRELEELSILSHQIAIALENAQLQAETQRRARELAALNKATRVITSTLELDTVLNLVLGEAKSLLGTEWASVLLHDPVNDDLVFAAAAGPATDDLVGGRVPVTQGIAGWVLREKQAALVNDVYGDPRFYNRVDVQTGLTTRSILAVPLTFKGVTSGVIEVVNKVGGAFNQHDLEMLEALAGSAATAIANAQLYQQEQEAYRRLQESQAELIRVEKIAALGRLAASLAHEINNPLQALRSGLRLLVGRPLDEEKRQRYLEVASREVERLIGIVERMLNFYRPTTEREFTDVNAVIEEILVLAGKQLQHSRVTVRHQLTPGLPLIETVAGQINQVFLNIILNALDAMPDGGELTVTTGWNGDRQAVRISFTDTGEGIPAEDIPRIFEPFFTRKLKGTGLGLTISYGIVERHGGRIEVESRVGEGSTFTVILPAKDDHG